MKRILPLGVAFLFLAALSNVFGQSAIIRGEVSPGSYENFKSSNQALNVNVAGSVSTAVFTTTTATVTNASSTILAANTSRKAVLIQNNDTAGNIFVNFTTTATTSNLKISPGQSIYLSGTVPIDAIRAIGSIASNANVVVVEAQ